MSKTTAAPEKKFISIRAYQTVIDVPPAPVRDVKIDFGVNWKCDTCGQPDSGALVMVAHARRTGHMIFTNVEWKGLPNA